VLTNDNEVVFVRAAADGTVFDVDNNVIGYFDSQTEEFTPITSTGDKLKMAGVKVLSAVNTGLESIDTPVIMQYYAFELKMRDYNNLNPAERRFLDLFNYETQQQLQEFNSYAKDLKNMDMNKFKASKAANQVLFDAFYAACPEWKQVVFSLLNPIWWLIPVGGRATRMALETGEVALKTGLEKEIAAQVVKKAGMMALLKGAIKPQTAIDIAIKEGLITEEHGAELTAKVLANEGVKINAAKWLALQGARVALIPPMALEWVMDLAPKGIGWLWRRSSYAAARRLISGSLTKSYLAHVGADEARARLLDLAKVLNVDITKLGENATTNDVLKAVTTAIHDNMRQIAGEKYARRFASNYAKELGDAMLIDATGGVTPEKAVKDAWIKVSRGSTASKETLYATLDRMLGGELKASDITPEFIDKEFPDLAKDPQFVESLRQYLIENNLVKPSEVVPKMAPRTSVDVANIALEKGLATTPEEVSLANILALHYNKEDSITLARAIMEIYSKAKVNKTYTISSFKSAIKRLLTKIAPKGAMEIPVDAQQRLLGMAGKGKAGFSTETMGLVYRDAAGNPIAVATLHPEANGAIRLGSLVITGKGLIKGKILKTFMAALKATPNLVLPPIEEMSPDAIRMAEKLGLIPVTEPSIKITDESIRDILDFLGIHAPEKGMSDQELTAEGLRRMAFDLNQARVGGTASLDAEQTLYEVYLRRDPALYNACPRFPDFNSIPNDSVNLGKIKVFGREIAWSNLMDSDLIMLRLANKTGVPELHNCFMRIYYGRSAAAKALAEFYNTIYKNATFKKLAADDTALGRITQFIRANNPRLAEAGLVAPELSTEEEQLANVLIDLYKSYENKVRYIRFWIAYNQTQGSVKGILSMIKGVTEEEIKAVCDIVETRGWVDAEEFLSHQTWGVIEKGYDPWQITREARIISEPTMLSFPRTGITTRLGVDYEEIDRNIIQRTAAYVRDIEFDYMMLPEIRRLDELLAKISPKLTPKARSEVTAFISTDLRHMKGVFRGGAGYNACMRVYAQAMVPAFWSPRLVFRNCFQMYAFYPDRAKLFKYAFKGMSPQDRIFYEEIVSQFSGISKDLMMRGKKAFPGLDAITRFANRTSLYPYSDDVFRELTFVGAMNQAREAAAKYLASGKTTKDIDRLFSESGLLNIEKGFRTEAFQKLTCPDNCYFVHGLEHVTGLDAFAYDVGKCITDLTNFKYVRAMRAPIEHGEAGILLFNLFTFPRSYAQRIFLKLGKLNPKADVSIAERVLAFRDIQNLMVVGSFVGWICEKVTGTRYNSYSPLNIMLWEPGGLALGAVQQLITAPTEAVTATNSALQDLYGAVLMKDPAAKTATEQRLATTITDTTRMFVPLMKEAVGILEAFSAAHVVGAEKIPWTQNMDLNFLRWVESKLDSNYNPTYTKAIERDWIENLQHLFFRSTPPDPTVIETSMTLLDKSEAKLGTRDETGHLWTLQDFGADVDNVTRLLPMDMIDERYGFSPLAMARVRAREAWKEYDALGDYPSNASVLYRQEHPDVDAWLFFWGRVSNLQSEQAIIYVMSLCSYYGITQEMQGTLIDEVSQYREERRQWEQQLYEYNLWQTPEDILNWKNYQ